MTRTDEVMTMMRRHLNGTAFVFSRTATGFDIDLDVSNPQWTEAIQDSKLSETSSFSIKLDEIDNKYTIIEKPRHIEWSSGVAPHFVPYPPRAPRQKGSDQVDLRVSAEPIRRLVRYEAEGQGFRETTDMKKLGIMSAVALGGVAAVVGTFVVIVNTLGASA